VVLLWVIEMTRMMRCGNYLQFIEDKINDELEGPVVTWENWLRRGTEHDLRRNPLREIAGFLGLRPDTHRLHHNAQLFLVIGLLATSLTVSWYLPFVDNDTTATQPGHTGLQLPFSPFILASIYTALLVMSSVWVSRVIFHGAQDRPTFLEWEKGYSSEFVAQQREANQT
ncbi:MAG: hypothetical protein WBD55_08225, partial [Dehalococcoidia bacterium]